MEKIFIENKSDSPKVYMDATTGEILIEGISVIDNSMAFYEPLFHWAMSYTENPAEKTHIKMRLVYFNTSSSKMILNLLLIFDKLNIAGHDVEVEWCYMPGDEDMLEAGEIYASRLTLPFIMQVDWGMEYAEMV